jgi:arylsulfatase A-like enzyme
MVSTMRSTWAMLVLATCAGSVGAGQPNIILVMADDLGWADVGFNGNTTIRTPHLDTLAAAGCRLERFYSAGSVCSPTRASCLTGRNGQRLGIGHANVGHVDESEITIAEVLRDHGYRTGHFGKWHLGTLTRQTRESNRGGPRGVAHYAPPWDHGFEVCFSTEAKVPTWDPMWKPKGSGRQAWAPLAADDPKRVSYGTHYWTGTETRVESNLDGDDSRVIVDRAVQFIERESDKPYFAVVWFHTPHLPIVAGPAYHEMYGGHTLLERSYYGCITALDEQVGRLVASAGPETVIWFCSDNGPEGQAKKAPGSAAPFRGRKRSLYEGGVRVPAIVRWPGQVEAGTSTSLPLVTSDYLPTILTALDIDLPADRELDGMDVLPLLRSGAERRGKPIGFAMRKAASWVTDQHKLITRDGGETYELFDLLADPGERNDIAAEHPELVASMRGELGRWQRSWKE